MPLEFAGATDVGRKRDHNEDALLLAPQFQLAVVCDGMGGHQAGEVASGIGVATVQRFFEIAQDPDATWPYGYDRQKDEPTNLLNVAAQWANQRIREAGEADKGSRRGLGTTFVGLLVRGARAHFGWVGDSRGYYFRRGELHPATSDHSLLNELVKTGRLTQYEIDNFQHRNVITRALGMADLTSIDVTPVDLLPGDVCLLCCDGLTGMVEESRIADILARQKDLNAACTELIGEANANGGVDNITVALVRYAP
ncbi:MAG TPA: PP2C family serine/threonine-protein phosphatase [Myxococcales bacterium]|nr:PP2C family serine/threonine-protein phosphatase [Myxococcales bacterium]